MTLYRYSGPVASVTLREGTFHLSPGADVELPSESPWVRRMVARKHLAPTTSAAVVSGGKRVKPAADASTSATHPTEVSAAAGDPNQNTQQDGE